MSVLRFDINIIIYLKHWFTASKNKGLDYNSLEYGIAKTILNILSLILN